MNNPRARSTDLLLQSTGDDLVVFDQQRNTTHTLNRTAALVFEQADGTRSVADLAALLQAKLNETADEDLVLMTLDKLRRAHLLEDAGPRSAETLRASRRRFVRKIGLVGALTLLLPAVETIVAPTSAMAQSGSICAGGCECACGCDCPCVFCEGASDLSASGCDTPCEFCGEASVGGCEFTVGLLCEGNVEACNGGL